MNLWTSYEPLLCIFTLAIYSCCNCMANYCLEHLQPYIFHSCPSAMQSNLYNLDVLTCVTKLNFFTSTACLWISGVWRGCGDHPASQKSPGAPKYRPLRLHCWRIHSDKTRRDYDRPLGNRGLLYLEDRFYSHCEYSSMQSTCLHVESPEGKKQIQRDGGERKGNLWPKKL